MPLHANNVQSFTDGVGVSATPVWCLSFPQWRSMWHCNSLPLDTMSWASCSSLSMTLHRCTGLWDSHPCSKFGQMLTDCRNFFNVHTQCSLWEFNSRPHLDALPHYVGIYRWSHYPFQIAVSFLTLVFYRVLQWCVRSGGLFNDDFTTNSVPSRQVFWKSYNI